MTNVKLCPATRRKQTAPLSRRDPTRLPNPDTIYSIIRSPFKFASGASGHIRLAGRESITIIVVQANAAPARNRRVRLGDPFILVHRIDER